MGNPEESIIVWSDYMKYRSGLREFELSKIENILRYSSERYFDTVTQHLIVVGKIDDRLVIIRPVTIHATTHQQIKFRVKTGRFVNE